MILLTSLSLRVDLLVVIGSVLCMRQYFGRRTGLGAIVVHCPGKLLSRTLDIAVVPQVWIWCSKGDHGELAAAI